MFFINNKILFDYFIFLPFPVEKAKLASKLLAMALKRATYILCRLLFKCKFLRSE